MMDKTFCKYTHSGAAEHLRQKKKENLCLKHQSVLLRTKYCSCHGRRGPV